MDSFFAEIPGSPARRLYLYRDDAGGEAGTVRGWNFVVDQFDQAGKPSPLWDTWAETFAEILMYPPEYANEPINWRRTETKEAVVIADLRFDD